MFRRIKFYYYVVNKFFLIIEIVMKKIENSNGFVFIVDGKVNKQQIKQVMRKFYGIVVVKVNILIRIDGEKVYVQLVFYYYVLDVINNIGIIYIEKGWLILNIYFLYKLIK